MSLRQRITSFSTLIPILVLFVCLIQYRPDSAADFGMYAKGGELVANGENPYTYSPFRSGPLIALFTHLILSISTNVLPLIQVVTIIGIYFFANTLLTGTKNNKLIALSLSGLLFLTISGRSLLSNIQITAYTLTLLAIIYRSLFSPPIQRSWVTKISVISCGVLLIDVRIQLGLIFLVYLVKARQFDLLIGTIATWASVHFLFFLLSGQNYPMLFIERLRGLSEETLVSGLSISPWRLTAELGIPTDLVAVISYLSVAILVISLCLRLNGNQLFLILFVVPPLLLVYVHPYDLLLPLVIHFCLMLKGGDLKIDPFLFSIGLLSPSYLSNFLFSGAILLLVVVTTTQLAFLINEQSIRRLFQNYRWLFTGFLVSVSLSVFLDETIRLSIVTLIFSLIMLLSQNSLNNVRDLVGGFEK